MRGKQKEDNMPEKLSPEAEKHFREAARDSHNRTLAVHRIVEKMRARGTMESQGDKYPEEDEEGINEPKIERVH